MGLNNLGIAVALAARAARYPEEFAILCEWQYATGNLRGAPALVANQVGLLRRPVMEIVAHIAEVFNLKFVGPGRRKLPFGYCRMPSCVTSGTRVRARKQFYMARYAPGRAV